MQQQLTAAVIAGGRSTRFGSPKTNAGFQGISLLQHALNLAREIAPAVMLSINQRTENIPGEVAQHKDFYPDCGPVGGLYTMLRAAKTPLVAMLPCDMPLLTSAIYARLHIHSAGRVPVVAQSHLGLEPLVSIWPTALTDVLEGYIINGSYSLRKIVTDLNADIIDLPTEFASYNPHWVANVNRTKDLEKIKEILR